MSKIYRNPIQIKSIKNKTTRIWSDFAEHKVFDFRFESEYKTGPRGRKLFTMDQMSYSISLSNRKHNQASYEVQGKLEELGNFTIKRSPMIHLDSRNGNVFADEISLTEHYETLEEAINRYEELKQQPISDEVLVSGMNACLQSESYQNQFKYY